MKEGKQVGDKVDNDGVKVDGAVALLKLGVILLLLSFALHMTAGILVDLSQLENTAKVIEGAGFVTLIGGGICIMGVIMP